MALIDNLISEIQDQKLRESIEAAVRKLKEEKTFGLVFEEHLPETVQLPTLRPRKGLSVVLLSDSLDCFVNFDFFFAQPFHYIFILCLSLTFSPSHCKYC